MHWEHHKINHGHPIISSTESRHRSGSDIRVSVKRKKWAKLHLLGQEKAPNKEERREEE